MDLTGAAGRKRQIVRLPSVLRRVRRRRRRKKERIDWTKAEDRRKEG